MCGAPTSLKQQPQLTSAYLLGVLFCFLLRKESLKNLEIQNVLITSIILLMTLRRCTHLPDKKSSLEGAGGVPQSLWYIG